MSSKLRVPLRVTPGATRSSVQWFGAGLKVKVSAPPERGKANAAVLALLAERLALPTAALRIVSGHGSQQKLLEIEGLDLATLQAHVG